MKIKDIIDRRTWDLPLIEKDNDLFHVFAILSGRDHVWVVDDMESKDLVGVITQHDILCALAPVIKISFVGRPRNMAWNLGLYDTAEQIMSWHPVSCSSNGNIEDALKKMTAHRIRRLAVVEDNSNKIIGEVTLSQLVTKYYHAIKPLYEFCEASNYKC